MEAIRNAIAFPYSNGLAKSTVNKIKVIKRFMFWRCGFHMLRRKVMLNNVIKLRKEPGAKEQQQYGMEVEGVYEI